MQNNSVDKNKMIAIRCIIIAVVLLWNGIPMLLTTIGGMFSGYMNFSLLIILLIISAVLIVVGISCIRKAAMNMKISRLSNTNYGANTNRSRTQTKQTNNTKQFKTKTFSTKPFETRYKSPAKPAKRNYEKGDNFFELEDRYEKSWLDEEREAENRRIARQKSTGEF